MLSPQADAGTEEPNRRSVSDLVLDGRRWRCGAGTSSHRGPFRQKTGLSVLCEGCRQGYSPYETQVDGLPIWGMSAKIGLNCGSMMSKGWTRAQRRDIFKLRHGSESCAFVLARSNNAYNRR